MATLVAVYAHSGGVFVTALPFFFAVVLRWRRDRSRRVVWHWVAANVAIAFGFAPWLHTYVTEALSSIRGDEGSVLALTWGGWSTVLESLRFMTVGYLAPLPVVGAVAAIAVGCLGVLGMVTLAEQDRGREAGVLATFFVIPTSLLAAMSALGAPVFATRLLMPLLPSLLILVAAAVARPERNRLEMAAMMMVLVVSVASLALYYNQGGWHEGSVTLGVDPDVYQEVRLQQWEQIASYIEQAGRPDDVVLLTGVGDEGLRPHVDNPIVVLPPLSPGDYEPVRQAVQGVDRVWLIDSMEAGLDEYHVAWSTLSYSGTVLSERDFYPYVRVYQFTVDDR